MDVNRENISIVIGRIIAHSISGTITPTEQAILDDWLQNDTHQQIYKAIRNGQSISNALSEFDTFDVDEGYRQFQASIGKKKGFRSKVWMAAAATIVVFLGLSVTIYLAAQKEQHQPLGVTSVYDNDIAPGGNRATLKLADGRAISLDE